MQQAKSAHSGVETAESSGNHDDISRRVIFAGIAGAAALLAITPQAAQAQSAESEWMRLLSQYEALKRHTSDLWTRYRSMPASVRERVVGEEVERASGAEADAWAKLVQTPAPHLPALRWKLEQLLEIEDDGMSASWCERLVRPVLSDITRLMQALA